MNTVFIIPTGIGCSIGGHAGDATPAFKLIASLSDIAITHPNVVNASDINEMDPDTWYVEGSILNRFLEGEIHLEKPKSNRILLAVNRPIRPETVNAVNAARRTIGCDIEILELETELKMVGEISADSGAIGWHDGVFALEQQVMRYEGMFDALAIASQIDVEKEVVFRYLDEGGVNPWGGIEAKVSRDVATAINKPVAHAPIETDDEDLKNYNVVVDSRLAAEMISQCYIHSVFKGLHKAPRISDRGLSVEDIDCLISPIRCWGRPHDACVKAGIPIIMVRENEPIVCKTEYPTIDIIFVKNYLEAAGYVQLLKEGMTLESISGS